MSHQITVSIDYLTHVETESGRPAKHGDGYLENGRFIPRVPTHKVDPTLVTIEVDERIATVNASWGDRIKQGETPKIYGKLVDGTSYETYDDGRLRLGGYAATDDVLLGNIKDAQRQVAEAWGAAIATRADVAAVVEDYRASVLDPLDRIYAEYDEQWDLACKAIAKKFRRQSIEIGEQTVPGKCCVRSTLGNLLGYANVWNGKWLGTVERV